MVYMSAKHYWYITQFFLYYVNFVYKRLCVLIMFCFNVSAKHYWYITQYAVAVFRSPPAQTTPWGGYYNMLVINYFTFEIVYFIILHIFFSFFSSFFFVTLFVLLTRSTKYRCWLSYHNTRLSISIGQLFDFFFHY